MHVTKSIVLIGMMGAGKSAIGRHLAQRTGFKCADTDELIASRFGLPIADIFSKHGEERFREAETHALRNLSPAQPTIVVTGGGIVLRRENVDLLKGLGIIVWLTADEATLFERASRRPKRPLLETEDPKETFSELLRIREPLYASAADLRVDTSTLTQDEVTEAILRKMDNISLARRCVRN